MEQEEDVVDAALFCKAMNNKKVPSIEALNSEMPGKGLQKERGRKMLKTFLNRLRLKKTASVTISRPDPTYRVAYLGNVVTGWAKGKGKTSFRVGSQPEERGFRHVQEKN